MLLVTKSKGYCMVLKIILQSKLWLEKKKTNQDYQLKLLKVSDVFVSQQVYCVLLLQNESVLCYISPTSVCLEWMLWSLLYKIEQPALPKIHSQSLVRLRLEFSLTVVIACSLNGCNSCVSRLISHNNLMRTCHFEPSSSFKPKSSHCPFSLQDQKRYIVSRFPQPLSFLRNPEN